MVNIKSETSEELKGLVGFGFRAKFNDQQSHDVHFNDAEEQTMQMMAIQQMIGIMKTLNNYPCEFDLTIGAELGSMIIDGDIYTFDKKARVAAQEVLRQLNQLCSAFTVLYPNSTFLVHSTQRITITAKYDTDPNQ